MMTRLLLPTACLTVTTILTLEGMEIPPLAQTRTVWDGVYSEAQARRGQELYVEICGFCHRDALTGGGSAAGAPTLRGPFFTTQWHGRPLVDLFVRVGTTMPQHNPDSLLPQVVIDIISFLLRENKMPPGQTELPPLLDPLREIVFTSRPD